MFSLCKSCQAPPTGSGFLVQKGQQPPKFYSKYADIREVELQDQKVSVLRINKSDYDSFSKALSGKQHKFVDQQFPPSQKSLGNFDNVGTDKWKRLSQINPRLAFFNKNITPADGVASNHRYNIGYQAALAAIAQKPQRVIQLFGNNLIKPGGIYTFLLRNQGKIEEVIVDDYIPINEELDPLFSKPNQQSSWNILLEKARAKIHGSYQKMIKASVTPKIPLQQITFAPTDAIKNAFVAKQDLWDKLIEGVSRGSILLGSTSNSQKINWGSINLTPSHYYNIIDAANLPHKLGSYFKVVKLRNAFRNEQYKGEGSLTDTLFWQQIENCNEKDRLLAENYNQGIIFMLFSDYLKYFEETLINHYEGVRNYFNQVCQFNTPNGLVYELDIPKEDYISVIIDQIIMEPVKKGAEYIQDGWGRVTLLLIKYNNSGEGKFYEFVNGALKYNQKSSHIRAKLIPGKYILYFKLQPTIKCKNFPKYISIATLSTQKVQLVQKQQNSYPDLLKKTFLLHGKTHKRQVYNNDLMWSSWRLIAQGGYAYIAFGNSSESTSKFVISFKQEIFNKQNYILKKPFKGKQDQKLQVLPGQQEIILLRIKNSEIKQINFPPPIDLEIVPV